METKRTEHTKILVVDDQSSMRSLVITQLRRLPFPVELIQAVDGSEAVRLVREQKPHLAVVDIEMSPMSGVDFVRVVRSGKEDDLDRFLPVMMLSGSTAMARVLEAMQAGAHGFVAKPISAGTLLGRAEMFLRSKFDFIDVKDAFGPGRNFFGPLTKWSKAQIIDKGKTAQLVKPPR